MFVTAVKYSSILRTQCVIRTPPDGWTAMISTDEHHLSTRDITMFSNSITYSLP